MKKMTTREMVLAAILTAIVVVLQFLGATIKLGPFSITTVLVPIVIGAATCGVGVGAWLGFVFGLIVLASGDAAPFMAVNVVGTIVTVLAKGTLCGLLSGVVYKALCKKNKIAAVIGAAIVCPVVNTGVFALGCFLFFMETITEWAGGGNAVQYIFAVMIGFNFLIEILVNIVLSPVIVRLLNVREK